MQPTPHPEQSQVQEPPDDRMQQEANDEYDIEGQVHDGSGYGDEQPKGKALKANAQVARELGWLTVSVPEEARGQMKFEEVADAIEVLLLELQDPERPDGQVEDAPTKVQQVDSSMTDGPWWFGFNSKTEVRLILAENGKQLTVETAEGAEITCSISLLQSTKDTTAYHMFEAVGFWGELYVGKSNLVTTVESAVLLLTKQLGVMVSSCKWPRSQKGQAPNKTKITFKAVPVPGAAITLPTTMVTFDGLNRAVPLRYRVQESFFPGLCTKCHLKKPQLGGDVAGDGGGGSTDDGGCICHKVKQAAEYNKSARKASIESTRAQTRAPNAAEQRSSSSKRLRTSRSVGPRCYGQRSKASATTSLTRESATTTERRNAPTESTRQVM